MNAADTIVLLPLILVGAVAVLVLLAIAFCRNHHLVLTLTLAGLVASFVSLLVAAHYAPRAVTPLSDSLIVMPFSIPG